MDESSLAALLVIFGLISLHALMALAYGALTNVRMNHLKDRAEDGHQRAKQVIKLLDGNRDLYITYQLITTLLQFMIASMTIVNVAVPVLTTTPGVSPLFGFTLALVIAASLTLILGVLVPEAAGSAHANTLALWVVGPIRALMVIFRPFVAVLLWISKLLSSLFSSSSLVNTVTEEEIMTLVDAGHTGGTIEEEEKDMIYSVLQLDETRVSEIMVPRIDIVAIDIKKPLDDARAKFIKSGFSRIPVFEETIDSIKGILYAKDLLTHSGNLTIKDLMRPAYYVPETKPVDELLKELQARRVHVALVVDEYGGTAGLVTIENIIEEIVGDIQDEYDLNEEEEYTEISDDEYIIDASMDLDDVNDLLDADIPTEDNDTLAGFIYTHLGRVPEVGEVIEYENLKLRVESVNGRRIRKVHVLRQKINEDITDDDNEAEENPALSDKEAG